MRSQLSTGRRRQLRSGQWWRREGRVARRGCRQLLMWAAPTNLERRRGGLRAVPKKTQRASWRRQKELSNIPVHRCHTPLRRVPRRKEKHRNGGMLVRPGRSSKGTGVASAWAKKHRKRPAPQRGALTKQEGHASERPMPPPQISRGALQRHGEAPEERRAWRGGVRTRPNL